HRRVYLPGTARGELSPLSLHDALPICARPPDASTLPHGEGLDQFPPVMEATSAAKAGPSVFSAPSPRARRTKPFRVIGEPISLGSEEHTSELQSRENPACRLLLEHKKV